MGMKLKTKPDLEKAIRCGCGLILRRKNWAGHWNGCSVGSARDATPEEVELLEKQEARLAKEAEEHVKWLEEDRRKRDVARIKEWESRRPL
jgi:hypothetical protein